jgi:ribokinase
MAGKVAIVGSLSMDLVVQAQRRPEKGETLRGTKFGMFAGGKGNNQAIAAARAGAELAIIGRVGNDPFGETLLSVLKREGVNTSGMIQDCDAATGIAHITVDASGNNYIVIVQQANLNLCAADIEKASDLLRSCDVLLMQLEVPIEPLCAAAKIVRKRGGKVILNPAPAPENGQIAAELLALVDIIVPNQPEALQLTGIDASTADGARRAATALHERGIGTAIVTLGELGALLSQSGKETHIDAFKVEALDSTAAGDAFCGALAAALASSQSLKEAVRFGCAAGALATTKLGAEPSLPYRIEIETMLNAVPLPA